MTERQYVEHIRKIAKELAAMGDQPKSRYTASAVRRWESVKLLLTPETAIALCDAWLAQEGRTEAKTETATRVAGRSE